MKEPVPVIGLAGYSGSGKTTFLEKLVAELRTRGYRIGVVKHTHHPVEFDQPGKDTWRHARAGAEAVVLAAPKSATLFRKFDRDPAPEEVITMVDGVDIIFVEGFKKGKWPKIEIYNTQVAERPDIPEGELLAVVSGERPAAGVTHFLPDDAAGVADFLEEKIIKK